MTFVIGKHLTLNSVAPGHNPPVAPIYVPAPPTYPPACGRRCGGGEGQKCMYVCLDVCGWAWMLVFISPLCVCGGGMWQCGGGKSVCMNVCMYVWMDGWMDGCTWAGRTSPARM